MTPQKKREALENLAEVAERNLLEAKLLIDYGQPSMAFAMAQSTLPICVMVMHKRLVPGVKHKQKSPYSRIRACITAKVIETEVFELLKAANFICCVDYESDQDVVKVLDACKLALTCSESNTRRRKRERALSHQEHAKPSPSLWRRWATAAAGLLTFSAS